MKSAFTILAAWLLTMPALLAQGAPAAPGVRGGATRTEAPAENAAVTLWNIIESGGWVMIPLGVISVMATMLILIYFLTIRRRSVVTAHYMNTADALLRKRDLLGLLAVSNRHNEAVARVVQKTLDFATKNPSADFTMVREVAEAEGTRQASAFNQQIVYLADIGAIAPMLGLLGTVIGMIKAFIGITQDAAVGVGQMQLAGGVAEALVTTATGLVIGIPAMVFYAYFRGQVQKLIAELESASTQIMALLALHYNKKKPDRERVLIEDEF